MPHKIIVLIVLLICCTSHAQSIAQANYFLDQPNVKLFIKQMVKLHHFKEEKLTQIIGSVQPRPKIIQSFKYPLELNPWYTYKRLYVTEQRIINGVLFANKYREALAKAEKIYGIPANIIVATIGIESRYGENVGEYPVIDALVNLAFNENARNNFFRKELEEFLLLTREQGLNPLQVMGSYAGAIGQPQFMPSSYRHYAVNFAGQKKIDLTHNAVDVIGSIANYYYQHGWQKDQPIAMPASMIGGKFQWSLLKPKKISLFELIENGTIDRRNDFRNQKYKIITLQERNMEYWLTFANFDVIKKYNHSELYAMAVYQLSYYIGSTLENLKYV